MEPVRQPEADAIRRELERILQSRTFERARRSQRFLTYLVEAELQRPPRAINEYAVAVDVFDRQSDYDSSVDATVRVEAGRLRARLRDFYNDEGRADPVVIDVPKGRYVATFAARAVQAEDAGAGQGAEVARAAPLPTPTVADAGQRAVRTPVRSLVAVCCLALVVVWVVRERRLAAGISVHSMAVLPLRDLSGSADENYLAEGMTDELNTELARIPHLRVISHDSVNQQQMEQKSLGEIGRELHVDTVVEGTVLRSGNRVRINAQLTSVKEDRQLWAASLEGDAGDLIALEDSVAQEIATHARLAILPGVQKVAASAERPSAEAYDAYLRGRYFLDQRDVTHSIANFQRAADLSPDFSSAYAGLAEALEAALTVGTMPAVEAGSRAAAAARRAIALDPENGPAYTALGTLELTQTWDWERAELDLRRGMQLSPGDSFPVTMYGFWLASRNRPQEAVAAMRRAAVMDPLSFYVSRNLGSALYYARRYEEALQQFTRTRELLPERAQLVDNWVSWTYESMGQFDQAVQHDLAAWHREQPEVNVVQLARVYQKDGWRAYWRLRLAQMPRQDAAGCATYEQGLAYLRIGETDRAVRQLQDAYAQRCFWIELAGVDPRFDPLRQDVRFKELLQRVSTGYGGH